MRVLEIYYPSVEQIVEINKAVLSFVRVRKADKAAVLSYQKLLDSLEVCTTKEGDVYDKAVVLLQALIQKHPFASGNRRTAFVVMADFLAQNGFQLGIKDDPSQAKVMQGVREGFYTSEEIKEWIRCGKIKPFKR